LSSDSFIAEEEEEEGGTAENVVVEEEEVEDVEGSEEDAEFAGAKSLL
jgi:hypothetical protein